MKPFHIIVAEDDNWYLNFLEYQLTLIPEYYVTKVQSGKELISLLYQRPEVITLDYNLTDFKGEEMLKIIKRESPNTEVVIVSGQNDVSTAINLLKAGAYDYVVKDDDTKERLWKTLANIKANVGLKNEVENLKDELHIKYNFGKTLIGNSPEIRKVFKLLEKATQTSINVSITGETGTGKEVVAKAIHYNSLVKKGPFVAINVSAIPKELIESELFGHEKGAFTGALNRRIGKFEEASGGTIFLDEIGEMDLNMQVKLLRVLQEREIVRLGGSTTVKLDCRIICATHRNLSELVKTGEFREDLFYRLIGLPVELPPLRDRKGDLLLLSKHFINQFASENNFPKKSLNEQAVKKMTTYSFPGNIRELKSIIDLAMVLSDDDQIKAEDISFQSSQFLDNLLREEQTLREINYKVVQYYLEKYNNNIQKAAKILDVGRSTIYRLLKENSR